MIKLGIADTMFATTDMFKIAEQAINDSPHAGKVKIERYTVPGIKDLPVACKKLIEEKKCEIVLALGYVGGADIDKACAHEASLGLIQAQLMTNKHIISAVVFEKEKSDKKKLLKLIEDRVRKHTLNCLDLMFNLKALEEKAGTGQRQGSGNAGRLGG